MQEGPRTQGQVTSNGLQGGVSAPTEERPQAWCRRCPCPRGEPEAHTGPGARHAFPAALCLALVRNSLQPHTCPFAPGKWVNKAALCKRKPEVMWFLMASTGLPSRQVPHGATSQVSLSTGIPSCRVPRPHWPPAGRWGALSLRCP